MPTECGSLHPDFKVACQEDKHHQHDHVHKTESGSICSEGESERGYIPSDGELVPDRAGCFINDAGIANYRATRPSRVYIGVLGRTADMGALEDWAWKGSMDTPGSPTLWVEPGY